MARYEGDGARYEGDGARYEGDAERRRPRLRVSKSVRERKRERRDATRDISAAGAAVLADADIEDSSPVELDIEDLGDITGHVSRLFDDGFAVAFELEEDDEDRLFEEIRELREAIEMEEA